eukprot:718577_1
MAALESLGDDDVDLEQQQFLSVTEYSTATTDNNNNNNSNNNNSGNIEDNNFYLAVSHKHGKAAFFTIFFKSLAILAYIFGSFLSSNFILIFVFVILCLACDFWTVKNVTGRLLVGLRWWNQVKDDGTSEWKFESKNGYMDAQQQKEEAKDSRLFWTSLYLTPSIWILLSIACMVKFNIKWLPLNLVAISLNGVQLWGYYRCRQKAKLDAQKVKGDQASDSMIDRMRKTLWGNAANAIGAQIVSQMG